jgi:hypothetical protein
MHKWILYCFALSIVLSCEDSPEDIPFRFDIQSVDLVTTSEEGTSDHNIKDVWVFNQGIDEGVFELPSQIPLLPREDVQNNVIQISPGVRNNGINSAPIIYPFYTTHFFERPLTRNEVEVLNLVFEYREDAKIVFNETFEFGNNFTFDEDGDPASFMGVSDSEVFEGERSGHISLKDSVDIAEVGTAITFTEWPSNGSPIFMEVNFKADIELVVGLTGTLGNGSVKNYFFVLNPTDEWKKVYIDLTFQVIDSGLASYKVLFSAGLQESQSEGDIYIDNVKIIHF